LGLAYEQKGMYQDAFNQLQKTYEMRENYGKMMLRADIGLEKEVHNAKVDDYSRVPILVSLYKRVCVGTCGSLAERSDLSEAVGRVGPSSCDRHAYSPDPNRGIQSVIWERRIGPPVRSASTFLVFRRFFADRDGADNR
jgi:hypothetical protein